MRRVQLALPYHVTIHMDQRPSLTAPQLHKRPTICLTMFGDTEVIHRIKVICIDGDSPLGPKDKTRVTSAAFAVFNRNFFNPAIFMPNFSTAKAKKTLQLEGFNIRLNN